MARSHLAFVVIVAIALAGCSGIRENLGGWFGETPHPTAAATKQGQAFYAAVDGLTV
ncbi:MAG TPA: hypothetical protein VK714_08930 [Myxococcota bacterium]|nr:hypothetical protein [Myxococcota bacterium]